MLERIPVSRAQIYNMIADGRFPRPTHLGGRGSYWVDDEINTWIRTQVDAERSRTPGQAAIQSDGIRDGIGLQAI